MSSGSPRSSSGKSSRSAQQPAASFDTVDGEIEDLVAPERPGRGPGGILRAEPPVQDERHLRLGDAAVRPKTMAAEAGEVVVLLRRADAGVGLADDHDVALAVERELEPPRGRRSVAHGLDSRDLFGDLHHVGGVQAPVAVNADEAAERAVVSDEPIGDRADDRAGALAEPRIEDVLEPDDVRGAV